jgi:prevent-host-death family protein
MEKAISAADANRKFSQLLRDVKEGQSYLVTSHGHPVARIEPITRRHSGGSARSSLLSRLRAGRVTDIGRWNRDELYE